MSLKSRYMEERRRLRELADEFAEDDPRLAHFLGSEASDPDVERLMEGFAFLTAKLAMKIDDHLPEITQPLLQLVYPNFLRPLPSVTLVRFDPIDHALSESQLIPKGTALFSRPVDGVNCTFRTCTDVTLYPLVIDEICHIDSADKSIVHIDLGALTEQPLRQLDCDRLSFHLGGAASNALTLYQWLSQHLHKVVLHINDHRYSLPPATLTFAGFEPGEALLPSPGEHLDGYRLIQEYFYFPQRFHGFNLTELRRYWPDVAAEHIRLELRFDAPFPNGFQLDRDSLSLYCTPAINLFDHPARPIPLDGQAVCEAVQPSGRRAQAYEIFSVDKVATRRRDTQTSHDEQSLEFAPYEALPRRVERAEERSAHYYSVTLEQDLIKERARHVIRLLHGDQRPYRGQQQTLNIDLTCCNGNLPLQLDIGDINLTTQATPSFATYRNLTRPTRCYPPALDDDLHGDVQWVLLSNLALNDLSLSCADALKAVLQVYDFVAPYDLQHKRATQRRLNAIEHASTAPTDWLIKGLPVRGMLTTLRVNPNAFDNEGDLQLFGSVLSHFMALYASSNSFHQLEIINSVRNTSFVWPARTGQQPVM
ncbi:type VI secretion system baseplate subunit TssF [Pseudomonas sp. BIGb0427]|uniref:type VI secretion system baseplate subunit TssF n=1 Tax=unclassified Pseudomonas TaxID=196821 RepID=UPI0018A71B93|nr:MULTISPECIES: type VI secretion system baseplate subunit TssF [unclassified Pseudomonas]QPG62366.1 type VI secretion system baseplate subunit TssF [Pseudomonas sp. BIGb0427]UVM64716.1 type VI secretion system baseplate subunit TssF [Pseudomonas sp. B21-009]